MKKYTISLGCIFTGLFLIFNVVSIEAAGPNEIVTKYFQALQEGNVRVVKNLISGNLYNKRRVLLEENQAYGDFLKEIYMDAHIQIIDVIEKDKIANVTVEIEFHDGNRSLATLLLKQDKSQNWKVIDEIIIP